MPATSSDIVIIGGGVIGMTLAWSLRREGVSVIVIDAGAAIPAATNAAAGMLAPSFESGDGAVGEALCQFSVDSLDEWGDFAPELEETSGLEIDYRPEGILGAAFSEQEAKDLKQHYQALQDRDIEIQWMSDEEARAFEPGLSDSVRKAVFAPNDGQVDPEKVLRALRRAFVRNGGVLLSEKKVTALEKDRDRITGVLLENGDQIAAMKIVIAGGAMLAEKFAGRAPIFPVKGEALSVVADKSVITRTVRAPGVYLCPKSDGRIVIGATEIPNEASYTISDDAIATLKSRAAMVAPGVSALDEHSRWAGLRPGTPDGAPVLGADKEGPDGLVYALGHYRNGVLLAPATAKILTAYLLGGVRSPFLAAFAVDRF